MGAKGKIERFDLKPLLQGVQTSLSSTPPHPDRIQQIEKREGILPLMRCSNKTNIPLMSH